jgi:hypothetical protein
VTIATRPGVTVTYLATRRIGPFVNAYPLALILLAGGNGLLQIGPNGKINSLKLNFLIRSRSQFLFGGAALVVAVDAPSDHPLGMDGAFRLSQPHAEDLAKVIGDVQQSTGLTVWLIGTSTGTLSAVNAAAREIAPTAAGAVLTSSQTEAVGPCGKKVSDIALGLAAITMPVLVAAHSNDRCACSPPDKADDLAAALTGASMAQAKFFPGGLPPQDRNPCEALTPHGFYRIEKTVAKAIVDWIKPLLP